MVAHSREERDQINSQIAFQSSVRVLVTGFTHVIDGCKNVRVGWRCWRGRVCRRVAAICCGCLCASVVSSSRLSESEFTCIQPLLLSAPLSCILMVRSRTALHVCLQQTFDEAHEEVDGPGIVIQKVIGFFAEAGIVFGLQVGQSVLEGRQLFALAPDKSATRRCECRRDTATTKQGNLCTGQT